MTRHGAKECCAKGATKDGKLSLKSLVLLILIISLPALAKTPSIKVRIAKSQKKVEISGRDLKRTLWTQNSTKQYVGKKNIFFNCYSKTRSKGYRKPIRISTLKSKTKLLNFKREKYKGKIHIQTSERFNGCDVINEISLEDYLATLLAKEMNPKWPLEALKAQAVAARSYAYHKIKSKQVSKNKGFNTHYDLENSEKHQVNGSYFDATRSTFKASRQTKGEILTGRNGKYIPVFFHSKCGGRTRRPEQVWSNKVKGYQSVECPFCHEHGTKNWVQKVPKRKFLSSLSKILKISKKKIMNSSPVRLIQDRLNASQVKMYVGDEFQVIKKSKLRSTLGRNVLPSNYFLLTQSQNEIKMIGSGYGHGVGMCQFGAKELALQGYTYKQILKHYFPDLKLKKIY